MQLKRQIGKSIARILHGLSRRMRDAFFVFIALIISSLSGGPTATAAGTGYVAPMAIDRSFGDSNGFADLGSESGGVTQLGFVRLPLSGGYIDYRTVYVAGVLTLEADRYTDAGLSDLAWGTFLGSTQYTLQGNVESARITVGVSHTSPAIERVHLVYSYTNGTNRGIWAEDFDADGKFLFQESIASGPNSVTGYVYAITDAESLDTGLSGSYFVDAQTDPISMKQSIFIHSFYKNGGARDIIHQEYASDFPADFRINQIIARKDKIDVVGMSGSFAMYMSFDVATKVMSSPTKLDVGCPMGSATFSLADGLIRDDSLGSDVLVYGHAKCTGGITSSITRISALDTTPTKIWSFYVVPGASGCNDPAEFCDTAFAAISSAGVGHLPRVVATNADGYLAIVEINAAGAKQIGTEIKSLLSGESVGPSFILGGDLQYPTLVSSAHFKPGGMPHVALSRINIDRIFANGVEQSPF